MTQSEIRAIYSSALLSLHLSAAFKYSLIFAGQRGLATK